EPARDRGGDQPGSLCAWATRRPGGAGPRVSANRTAAPPSRALVDSWGRVRHGRPRARRPPHAATGHESRLRGRVGRVPLTAGTPVSRAGGGLLCRITVVVCPYR